MDGCEGALVSELKWNLVHRPFPHADIPRVIADNEGDKFGLEQVSHPDGIGARRNAYRPEHTRLGIKGELRVLLSGKKHLPMPLSQRTYKAPFMRSGSFPFSKALKSDGSASRVERI
jgi:hypothetical protein